MAKREYYSRCDQCGRHSDAYECYPTCTECGEDVCPTCADMATYDPETGRVKCRECLKEAA